MTRHQITALMDDPDADKPNPIHSTDTARAHGFRGALVGGVTAYGWTVRTITQALGESWLDNGWVHVKFVNPVYPGDVLDVDVSDGKLTVNNADGICFAGEVGVGRAPWLDELAVSQVQPGQQRATSAPLLTLANAPVGEQLKPMVVPLSVAQAHDFAREQHHETLPVFFSAVPRVHPAWLAERLIHWLHHSFDYGPAIHTSSHIQHLARAQAGQSFTVTGCCVDAFERNGHHYIVNDASIHDEGEIEVARVRHTAIFRLRPPV